MSIDVARDVTLLLTMRVDHDVGTYQHLERVGADGLGLDDVDQRLLHRHVADALHVVAPDVLPPVDLVLLVLLVLDGRDRQRSTIGQDDTALSLRQR